ncbi:MAG: ATP-binding protein [Pseudomonadota bacterium]
MAEKGETIDHDSQKFSLKLAIVGGNQDCKFFLELFELLESEPFPYLDIKLAGVCDIDPEAEGLRLAQQMGIYTTNDFRDLFKIKALDGVIELTGRKDVLLDLIRARPRGVGVLEHDVSRLLMNLLIMNQSLQSTERQVALEKGASDFLIQQANQRIVVLKPDFTIVDANDSYLDAVTKFKHEVIGAHCYEVTHGLNAPCSRSQPGLECPLAMTLKTGESAQVIHEHKISRDDVAYCDMVTYPIKDQAGRIVRIIEVWRDITEELSYRWEKRAKALKADLRKLVQEDRLISLGKLVSSSVHEINNPIQGLLTFTLLMQEILDEGDPNPEDLQKFREHLSLMAKELERCGEIVSGLLSFSRSSSVDFRDVDLNEILEQVIALTRHKMELQNIRINSQFSPRPLLVNGDQNQLQQCFLNLIFNAIEAMPEGGQLNITSRINKSQKNAVVSVEDTGSGIIEENLDHIFDPFFTTKEEGEGTGLGLSIVHGVVKTHKGEIHVKSKVGEGSSFILHFPLG